MNPIKPDQKRKNTSISASKIQTAYIENLTFGESEVWDPYLQWCADNDVIDAYYLIVTTFRMFDPTTSEIPLKSIINCLTNNDSLDLLAAWSKHDAICDSLYQFAIKAKYNSNSVLEELGPISSNAYSGLKLNNSYLLMLFFESGTLINPKSHLWITQIRIWLLIHAIYRTKRGVFFDHSLRKASGYLVSQIRKQKTDWEDILKLKINPAYTESFSGFDAALNMKINAVDLGENSKRFKMFYNSLQQISQTDGAPYNVQGNTQFQGVYNKILDSITIKNPYLTLNESDSYWQNHTPVINREEIESHNYAIVEVDSSQSYTHQKLSVNSRIINQDEYLHFLPWSWNRLTTLEQKLLNDWINSTLKSADAKLSLLAALSWIAINTGRTLLRVLDFEISDDLIHDDWTLSLKDNNLKRQPAKKEGSWTPKTVEQHDWVEARSRLNIISLPIEIKNILSSEGIINRNKLTAPKLVGDIWGSNFSDSIEVVFSSQMKNTLPRVKSGMLATLLSQKIFNNANNGNFSQLLSSHPQVPLLGAFAYGSWDCEEVHTASTNILSCDANHMNSSNIMAIGSYLNPIEGLLIEAIKNTTSSILTIDKTQDPIEFHNAYSAYLIISLMAGTGIRAVNDVFESIIHFNFSFNFVFINDKASDESHMGRLTPIPEQCSHILKNIYPLHLKHMALALNKCNPELSAEINNLIENPSGNLPLFFLIDPETLDWKQISPSSIDSLRLFDWPLPANLFRQRLAKRLDKAKVNQNVINAWLGHKETNVAHYGDQSIRCWLVDLKENKVAFDRVYNQLGFKTLSTFRSTPTINRNNLGQFSNRNFGIQARTENRNKRREEISKQAKTEIEIYLNKRDVTELSHAELETLESKLFLNHEKKPHVDALIRSELLNKLIDEAWESKNEKVKISNRRIALNDTFTHATEATVQYLDLYLKLKEKFEAHYKSVMPSKTTKVNARFLTSLALIFENRICYSNMLIDIYEEKNFRLIQFKKQFYLEYSENIIENNWKLPVQRHHISTKTAALADKLLSGNRKPGAPDNLGAELIVVLRSYNLNVDISKPHEVIKLFCEITSAANALELPGNVSGFLSGRIIGTSLNWIDWLRILDNKILLIPDDPTASQLHNKVDDILKSETTKYNLSVTNLSDNLSLMIYAKDFFKEISNELKLYHPNNRQNCNDKITALIRLYQDKVSSAILLTGEWINNVVKKGKSATKAFSKTTPSDYFSALSSHMIQIAFDKDLFLMDSEEITDLYSDFLESTKNLVGTYHADRLITFNTFCSQKGIEDPNWSDLDMPKAVRSVSPGVLSENDYRITLSAILHNIEQNQDAALYMAFLLICCYRFGLRSKEAIYLKRQDWIEDAEGKITYILVRNSKLNELKSVHSKRIVPLLFELSDDELGVIDKIKANYHATYHDDTKAFLFFSQNHEITPRIAIIRSSLIALLKQITGNSKFVNHHLRHSFFNIINLGLLNLEFPTFKKIINNKDAFATIRKITLGDQHAAIGLRNNMAAARLMGHTQPRMGFLSYNHFTDIWADTFSSVINKKSDYTLKNCIDIDQFKRSNIVSPKLIDQLIKPYTNPSPVNLIKFLSLISSGLPTERATNWLNLKPEVTSYLMRICYQIENKNSTAPDSFEKWNKSLSLTTEWLKKIPKSAWKRLTEISFPLENETIPTANAIIEKDKIIELVGANRQLTLWKESHLSTIQLLMSHLDIPTSSFQAFSLTPDNSLFKSNEMKGIEAQSDSNRKDLDQGISADSAPTICKSRINLIYKKNSTHSIRDAYQLIVCLIILAVSIHSQVKPANTAGENIAF